MVMPGGMLGLALGLSQLAYLAVMGTLGVRLLLMARRSRRLPEALLSAHFLLCCTVAYVLLASGMAIAQQGGGEPSPIIFPLIAAGHLLSVVGVFAVAAFNYLVFRRRAAIGRLLLGAAGACLLVAYVGYGASGGFADAHMGGGWYAFLYGSYMAVAVWVLWEPLLFWSRMRRRQQLGLAEPLEVNRFLLWGTGSAFRFVMLAAGALPVVLAEVMTPEHLATWGPLVLISAALAGIGVAGAYWLTFFPTRAYLSLFRGARTPSAG